jgi:hypothetical protein
MPTQQQQEEHETRAQTRRASRSYGDAGIRVDKPQTTSLGRIGLIISSFIFAGMVLFTLSGYERISRAYADINALNNEIDLTILRINELDVQIECAVTIQDAQKAAESYGMRYPEKGQYVRIGDALPFDNSLPTSTQAPADDTPAQPETPPDPSSSPDSLGGGDQPPAGG